MTEVSRDREKESAHTAKFSARALGPKLTRTDSSSSAVQLRSSVRSERIYSETKTITSKRLRIFCTEQTRLDYLPKHYNTDNFVFVLFSKSKLHRRLEGNVVRASHSSAVIDYFRPIRRN